MKKKDVRVGDKVRIARAGDVIPEVVERVKEAGKENRSSKAALNATMQGLAAMLAPNGIGVLILHPGGVKTRMGPSNGISEQ